MPRNPAAKKNLHNHKHENGLVGPGKRVAKQRSNGQLNGTSRVAHPDTPPLTPVNSNPVLNAHLVQDATDSLCDAKEEEHDVSRPAARPKRDSESSYDGPEPAPAGELHKKQSEDGTLGQQASAPLKVKSSPEVSSFHLASTILKSCPAYDTIALLIILLQLPPIMLTLVQALFASLTFMPPVSFNSMLSFFDVFQGSAGAPALGTMVFVDVICFGLWFCLWDWAQNFALDLAQVQVAITLGGGNSGKSGGVNGICFSIVLFLHLGRSKGVRSFFLNRLFPTRLMEYPRVANVLQFLPQESDFGSTPPPPSWLHSLFAVHIITQALMAFIRRRVAGSQGGVVLKSSKRTDMEASAGSHVPQELASYDMGQNSSSATAVDFQPPPTPGLKDGKDKVISAKKRRRQANQVKSRQPFWAALASTKVTVMREYEHSRGPPKAAGTELDKGNEGTSGDETIWITRVDPSTIEFEAANIPPIDEDQEAGFSQCGKPFYVRINGARWHSFALKCLNEDKSQEDEPTDFCGDISGLAPNCTYTCSFIRTDNDCEFCSITVKTPILPDRDQASSLAAPQSHQSLRPSSPTTTIKNSIQTAENKLNDARNRLTKTRRTHKAALAKVEREIDSFNSRLKSSSDETKQRQKLLQAQNNIRQNEEAAASIANALDNLAVIPEDDVADYSSRKEAFQKQSSLLAAANEALASARAEADGEVSGVNNDLSSIVARRERLTTRQSRLAEQHDRITQANTQNMTEKERKAQDSIRKEKEHSRIESQYKTQFSLLSDELSNVQQRTSRFWQEIQGFERRAVGQNPLINSNDPGQLTPEGELPGTQARVHHATIQGPGYGFPSVSALPPATRSPDTSHASPFLAYTKTLASDNFRRPRSASNRSGGALSNFSGDFDDADPIPPMPMVSDYDVNRLPPRKDSGSSRGHNNGSPSALAMTGVGSPLVGRGSPGHGIW